MSAGPRESLGASAKRRLRAALGAAGLVPGAWALYRALFALSRVVAEPYVQGARRRARREELAIGRRLSPDLVVLDGPFAGLRYPDANAAGSALLPKIVGTYERELAPQFERLLANPYSDVIDVGCAEGYYAVGLARRLPAATVHAFDASAEARDLCRRMAAANGVAARVRIHGACDERALLDLAVGPRALVVSDCEGFEARLFTAAVVERLRGHDVVIEVHDRDDPELPDRLRALFAGTHDVTSVESLDDGRKLRHWTVPALEPFDATTRRRIVAEGRASIMEWLVFESRSARTAAARRGQAAA